MKAQNVVRLVLLAIVAGGLWWFLHGSSSDDDSAPEPNATVLDFPTLDRTNVEHQSTGGSVVTYPPELSQLNNQRVSIVGFMAPYEEIDNMRRFMLLPGYVGCFFCSPPSYTQVVLVEQGTKREGKLPFINSAIMVTGTLRLYTKDSQHPAHQAGFVYALDDAKVQEYKGPNAPTKVQAPQPRKGLLSAPLAQQAAPTAPNGAPMPHNSFQPQFLVTAVTDLRKLPMLKAVKFEAASGEDIERRLSESIAQGHTAEEWQVRQKALAALGLADASLDLPKTLAAVLLRNTSGFYDPASSTLYYSKDLKLTMPEGRMEMVKLITEALLALNTNAPSGDTDAVLAGWGLRFGDMNNTARLYDEKTRLQSTGTVASPGVTLADAKIPAKLQKLGELLFNQGAAFVTHVCPDNQLDKLSPIYDKPPVSTAQLLHPSTYQQPAGPAPAASNDNALSGEKPVFNGVLGEALLTAWLGKSAPEGWRNDRFALWGGNEGDSWMWETDWKDDAAAQAFFKDARSMEEAAFASAEGKTQTDTSFTVKTGGRSLSVIFQPGRARVAVISAGSDAKADALGKLVAGS